MTLLRRLPLVLALLLAAAPAHAEVAGNDTGFTLQGQLAYDCFGCGDTATFTGVATFVTEYGVTTRPATGTLYVGEVCGSTTGGLDGGLHIGATDYNLYVGRTGNAVTGTAFGPYGWYAPDAGGGTWTLDAPSGTCGVPATASLTMTLVPFFNCACYIGNDR